MNRKFESGHFGKKCDQDPYIEYEHLYKAHIRRKNFKEPDFYWRQHSLQTHRERVQEVKQKVDNVSPLIPTCPMVSQNAFNRLLANRIQNERDNCILLKNIQTIYTGHGLIDNQLNPHSIPFRDTSKIRQTKAMDEIYQNCCIYRRLQNIKPTISRKNQMEWYKKQTEYKNVGSRYPIYNNSRLCETFEKVAWAKANENPRPIVYMNIEATDKICGRICLQLMADICPMTCENFRSLCTGDRGISYTCTSITHIRPGMFWRGGGEDRLTSIYGESFPNENDRIKHDKPGILSMTSHGPKTINTEYQISAKAFPPLDGVYVAFGQVVQGMEFLEELAKTCNPTEHGKLRIPTKITACGETSLSKMDTLPHPKLYKNHKEELILAREIKAVMQMRHRVQDLKAELEDLNRKPSLISTIESDSGAEADESGA